MSNRTLINRVAQLTQIASNLTRAVQDTRDPEEAAKQMKEYTQLAADVIAETDGARRVALQAVFENDVTKKLDPELRTWFEQAAALVRQEEIARQEAERRQRDALARKQFDEIRQAPGEQKFAELQRAALEALAQGDLGKAAQLQDGARQERLRTERMREVRKADELIRWTEAQQRLIREQGITQFVPAVKAAPTTATASAPTPARPDVPAVNAPRRYVLDEQE